MGSVSECWVMWSFVNYLMVFSPLKAQSQISELNDVSDQGEDLWKTIECYLLIDLHCQLYFRKIEGSRGCSRK